MEELEARNRVAAIMSHLVAAIMSHLVAAIMSHLAHYAKALGMS